MTRSRTFWAFTTTLVAALLISASVSTAAPHLGSSDGRYAGTVSHGAANADYVIYKIHRRKVYALTFQVIMDCHDEDDNTDGLRAFTSREAPAFIMPSSNHKRLRFSETSGGRDGHVSLEFDHRNRGLFSAHVTSVSALETCVGDTSIRIRRGRLSR